MQSKLALNLINLKGKHGEGEDTLIGIPRENLWIPQNGLYKKKKIPNDAIIYMQTTKLYQ